MMKERIKYISIGIAIVILLLIPFYKSGALHTVERITQVQTDTIYIDKPYKVFEIKKEVIEKPVKVYVYKTDTIFRDRMEKDTLISGVNIRNNKALVHTISPLGEPTIKEYQIPSFKTLKMDYKGNLQITPYKPPKGLKTLKTVGMISLFVGGVIIGSQLN